MGLVAFLSDFGIEDGFVGTVKGVIKSISPSTDIIDITHHITPFDIVEGALTLKASYKYFPKKTVFLCVVDPGVGTDRRAIAVETEDYFFVAPDNGLISLALEDEKIRKIVEITDSKYTLKRDNETFHGRDIFAPVSAYLSKGVDITAFGREINDYKRIQIPKPKREKDRIVGEIVKFDHFGNGITNIQHIDRYKEIKVKGIKVAKVCRTFLEGEEGKLNMVKGSFGYYEVFVPKGSAKDMFNLQKGDKVEIILPD
ncbi:MAG: SAM-dependent chlorinase/fluorinase [Aquificae bacterium]|nr:SAM-dependent chlorinase/fluorinase [Aquificota bacterium]